jgi:hypothetical protein
VQEVNCFVPVNQSFRNCFSLGPCTASKNYHVSHILAHDDFLDDRYPKSQVYIAELILDTFEYLQGDQKGSVQLMTTAQKHAKMF